MVAARKPHLLPGQNIATPGQPGTKTKTNTKANTKDKYKSKYKSKYKYKEEGLFADRPSGQPASKI